MGDFLTVSCETSRVFNLRYQILLIYDDLLFHKAEFNVLYGVGSVHLRCVATQTRILHPVFQSSFHFEWRAAK